MSMIKKYRCRYFGADGLPIPGGPVCNNGADCRFVHPTDPNWPGKTPFVDMRDIRRDRDSSKRPKDNNGRGTGPLAPQSDVFQRKKDHEDRDRDRHRDERGRDKHRNRSRNGSTTPTRRHPDVSRADIHVQGEAGLIPKLEADLSSSRAEKWGSPVALKRIDELKDWLGCSEAWQSEAASTAFCFRSHEDSLSNEIVSATAAKERESQKLQTYTEISSALSKVSKNAANSVAPALADIMIRHEQCKHRVDENFKALGGLWDEVFDVFCGEVAKRRLERAANSDGWEEISGEDDEPPPGRSSGTKRRRLNGDSPCGSPQMDDILALKMKINEQAYSLQMLTKENSELKNTLKETAAEGPLPQPTDPTQSQMDDIDEGNSRSRSVTPDNDAWQDEPSSALATRLVRAHSNPSPPPEPDSGPPTPSHESIIPFPMSFAPATANGNLISFDSSAELLPAPAAPVSNVPSVDELLSTWSPSAQPTTSTEGLSEATEEQQQQAIVVVAEQPAPQTPLRRSTRPRKSATPHAHLVPLPPSDDESSPGKVSPRTRRKGKEKDAENSNGPSTASEPLLDEDTQKRRKGGRKSAVFTHRQLGSLSPGSANALTQLVPSSGPSAEEPQRPFSFSVFAADAVPPPAPLSPPIRASPVHDTRSRSPARMQAPEELFQSPARRIPVEEAVARGQISPQRAAQLLSNAPEQATSSKMPIFHIPAQDSPARRVLVAPPTPGQGKWQGMRFGSPTRSPSPERSRSPQRSRSPERVASTETRPPWNASTSRAPVKSAKLPFPLVPSTSATPSIASSTSDASSSAPSGPSVIKIPRSTLKQPTSRIPRIGQKPYSRPPTSESAAKPSKLPLKTPATVKAAVGYFPVPYFFVLTEFEPKTVVVARSASGPSSEPPEAGPSSLKRKRPPSPQIKPRPVVLRQAPPKAVASAPSASLSSPAKRGPVTKFRMVDLHAKPASALEAPPPEPELDPTTSSPVKRVPVSTFRLVDLHASRSVEPVREKSPELVTELTPQLRLPEPEPVRAPSPLPPETSVLPPPSPSPSPPATDTLPDAPPEVPLGAEPVAEESVRRTTRVRKMLFPISGAPQPLSRRKAAPAVPMLTSGPFAGMTAVALRTLTSSNTVKNQQYLAAKLETQVVKKEGDRPESPGMKVRTIAQREADERGAKRKERAARRARRGEDVTEDEANGIASDEMDVDTDLESSPLSRHRRGPGDDEDYETPRPSVKRARSGSVGEDEDVMNKKRVKWDRGLSTSVFLDEVEPRPWTRPKDATGLKGCLAPTTKLDPFGNHPQAEAALQLVEENIVIKKFVYDNDEPEPPPVAPVRTRSKSKRKS
ncbi:C3H1-type domain-containing protein [Mycena chlorophos]|uniref:C3H1-type domain-containing protein n=1 Tax=Mycena chlorophos TaxID=658473 RepID=A0A8H6TS27_MYCCL|nr:C3H1-type domain-containing protein [Mycena chlorophos]